MRIVTLACKFALGLVLLGSALSTRQPLGIVNLLLALAAITLLLAAITDLLHCMVAFRSAPGRSPSPRARR